MNKRMIIMLVACAVVLGGVFGLKWFQDKMMSQVFSEMAAGQTITVSATEAKEDDWILSLNAVGTVRAIDGVDVTTEAPGVVETINFESGDRVEQGDVLIKLRDDVDQAQLRALQAAAAEAESGYERARKLYAEDNLSESERDLRRSQLVQAESEAKAQQERINQKTIRAPFAGELGIRQVNKGQYIQPGTPVVNLQSLAPIHVDFSLPEQRMSDVETGMKVRAELSAYPDKQFEGRITALEPGVNSETRNFSIQARFPNEEKELRPGMFADVNVQLPGSEDVVVIPRTAISFNPYGNSVYVIQEKTSGEGEGDASGSGENAQNEDSEPTLIVKRRFVETGRTRGTLIAVTDGLKPGERVVSSGLLKLRNNAEVEINNEVTPPEDTAPQPDNR